MAPPSGSTVRRDGWSGWWRGYWFEEMPTARLDWVARAALAVTAYMLAVPDHWVADHGIVPESWYQPVLLARLVHLPAPTEFWIDVVRWGTAAACVVAMPRRAPRLTSAVVFMGSTTWLLWAFSYGKVDHDRLTITVALFVLAMTQRTGASATRQTGWAIRVIQVVFALAYPLSALAKMRRGGWDWANSAVFTRAIVRRGSELGEVLLDFPMLLRIGQWSFVIFEVVALTLVLRNRRLRSLVLVGVVALHLFTYLTIRIHFLPHSIFLVAFLPMERLDDAAAWVRSRLRPDRARAVTESGG